MTRSIKNDGIDKKIVDLPEKTDAINEYDYMALDDSNVMKSQKLLLNNLGTQIGEANKIIDSDTIVVEETIVSPLGTVQKLKTVAVEEQLTATFEHVGIYNAPNQYDSREMFAAVRYDTLYLSSGVSSGSRLSIAKTITAVNTLQNESIIRMPTNSFADVSSNLNKVIVLNRNATTGGVGSIKWQGDSNKIYFTKSNQVFEDPQNLCTVTLSGGTSTNLLGLIDIKTYGSNVDFYISSGSTINKYRSDSFSNIASGSVIFYSAGTSTYQVWNSGGTKDGVMTEISIHIHGLDIEYKLNNQQIAKYKHGYTSTTTYFASGEATIIRNLKPSSCVYGNKIIYKVPFVKRGSEGYFGDVSYYVGTVGDHDATKIISYAPTAFTMGNLTVPNLQTPLVQDLNESNRFYIGFQSVSYHTNYYATWDFYRVHLNRYT